MSTSNFTTTLLVDQTPETVFKAINNITAWWTANLEGSAKKLHDEFTVRFGETFITMQVAELAPAHKVVWLVTDCYKHWIAGNKTEWKGTKISFDISTKGSKTQLHFEHVGLVPKFECYEGCANAWTEYLHESLLGLITTGKGKPTRKAKAENVK